MAKLTLFWIMFLQTLLTLSLPMTFGRNLFPNVFGLWLHKQHILVVGAGHINHFHASNNLHCISQGHIFGFVFYI